MSVLIETLASVDVASLDIPGVVMEGKSFFKTPVGGVVSAFTKAIAAVIGLAAIFMSIKKVLEGKAVDGVKIIVGAFIIAAILWQPSMIEDGIDGLTNLVSKLMGSIDDIDGSADAS